MDRQNGYNDINTPRFHVCGPLLLDGMKSAAYYGDKPLPITVEEYDALFVLAVNKNNYVPFDRLHEAAWHEGTAADAAIGIANIQRAVNNAGAKSMRIDFLPERGYIFKIAVQPAAERLSVNRLATTIKIASTAAVVAALVMFAQMSASQSIRLTDDPAPLGLVEINETRVVIFPDVSRVEAEGTDAAIDFYNSTKNIHYISFEIVMDGSRLYVSGIIAPGGRLEQMELDEALAAGEYEAEMVMRAYDPASYEESETKTVVLILTVR